MPALLEIRADAGRRTIRQRDRHSVFTFSSYRLRQQAATASSIRSSLPSFSTGTSSSAQTAFTSSLRAAVDEAALEPLGHDARRRYGMRAAERLKARRRDDPVDDLQLETHPNVQRAVLGFARHETWPCRPAVPAPFRRCEVPLDGWAVFHRRVNSLAEKGQAEHHAGADSGQRPQPRHGRRDARGRR